MNKYFTLLKLSESQNAKHDLPLDEETDSSCQYIVERIYTESVYEPSVLAHESVALAARRLALCTVHTQHKQNIIHKPKAERLFLSRRRYNELITAVDNTT